MLNKITRRVRAYFFHRSMEGLDREARFSQIYRKGWWATGSQPKSGSGSTLQNTADLREELPRYLHQIGAKAFLDAPCGDMTWMQTISLPDGVSYIGADIVPDLIDNLNENLGGNDRFFMQLDIVEDQLPDVDVMMCRDCLFHLSETDIQRFLKNFVESGIPKLLTTYMPEVERNKDIATGGYRPLNLTLAPFCLPEPKITIKDYVPPRLPKYLAEWTREEIAASL